MTARYNRSLLLLFLVSLSFSFLACDNCSDTLDQPVTAPIRFKIVDLKGENLVNRIRSHYSVDSIKLFDLGDKEWIFLNKEYLPDSSGYVFSGDCRKDGTGKSSLLLHFNSADSDTLDVWYEQIDDKCFTIYEYTHFQHNGKDLQKAPLSSILLITKAE
jgi:hypothetical protein